MDDFLTSSSSQLLNSRINSSHEQNSRPRDWYSELSIFIFQLLSYSMRIMLIFHCWKSQRSITHDIMSFQNKRSKPKALWNLSYFKIINVSAVVSWPLVLAFIISSFDSTWHSNHSSSILTAGFCRALSSFNFQHCLTSITIIPKKLGQSFFFNIKFQ